MKSKKLLFPFIFTILVFSGNGFYFKLSAQQDPMYTQYMFNKLVFNPAVTGSRKGFNCITILYHNQWTGFGGDEYVGMVPTTTTFSFNAPRKGIISGFGLYIIEDKLGFQYERSIHLTASAGMDLSFGTLHGGINAGMIDGGIDPKWNPHDLGDKALWEAAKSIKPDLGAGLYLFTSRYYLGISSLHLLPVQFDWNSTTQKSLVIHTYLTGGVNFPLPSKPYIKVQPSLLIKTDHSSVQFDLNANLMYKDRYWIGLQYKNQAAVSALLGLKLSPRFRLGYSYDITTNEMRYYDLGTHEIMIDYCFNFNFGNDPIFDRNIIWTPRWL